MFGTILKGKKEKKKKGDSASFIYADGTEANSELHEQMVAGVDDSDLREESAKAVAATGKVSMEVAYRAVGLPPPTK